MASAVPVRMRRGDIGAVHEVDRSSSPLPSSSDPPSTDSDNGALAARINQLERLILQQKEENVILQKQLQGQKKRKSVFIDGYMSGLLTNAGARNTASITAMGRGIRKMVHLFDDLASIVLGAEEYEIEVKTRGENNDYTMDELMKVPLDELSPEEEQAVEEERE